MTFLKTGLDAFSNTFENRDSFFNIFEQHGFIFKLSLNKYFRPKPRRPGPGPPFQAPLGVFFKLSLEIVFSNKLENGHPFSVFLNTAPRWISKIVTDPCFQSFTFEKGCNLPPHRLQYFLVSVFHSSRHDSTHFESVALCAHQYLYMTNIWNLCANC